MKYRLFLDDVRDPVNEEEWIIARDFDEAAEIVEKLGFPEFVSFDHDLGLLSLTGYDFAKLLIEIDLDTGDMPDNFDFAVHSANPVGSANIRGILARYIEFRREKND